MRPYTLASEICCCGSRPPTCLWGPCECSGCACGALLSPSRSSSSNTGDTPQTTPGTCCFPFLEQLSITDLSSSCAKSSLICGFISCLWTCSNVLGNKADLGYVRLPRLSAACDSAEGCVHLRDMSPPLGGRRSWPKEMDEVMTVSLMGCCQQYTSGSAVPLKPLFKRSGTISVLATVWCHSGLQLGPFLFGF